MAESNAPFSRSSSMMTWFDLKRFSVFVGLGDVVRGGVSSVALAAGVVDVL